MTQNPTIAPTTPTPTGGRKPPPRGSRPRTAAAAARASQRKSASTGWAHWGFGSWKAGRTAYTAEDLARDIEADARRENIRATGCPRNRAEDCRPLDVPGYYRSTRRRVDGRGRPYVETLCWECVLLRQWQEERRFREEFGELGPRGVRHSLRDELDLEREANELLAREWRELLALAGAPHARADDEADPLTWYDVRVMLASVRRCLAEFARADVLPL